MSNKFNLKVGDKVKVREWDEMKKEFGLDCDGDIATFPCFTRKMKRFCGKIMTIKSISISSVTLENAGLWCFDFATIKPIATARKIVIETNENETVASLYEDEKLVKTATAKCSPDDTFDLGTGAKIAIDRLMRNVEKEFTPHLEAVGNCYGVLGTPTKYKDILGKELFVGDTVSVFDDNGRMITETPIVETKEGGQFVMGIEKDCDKEAGTTGKWEILKSHSYEDIKDGTHVNFVTYIK